MFFDYFTELSFNNSRRVTVKIMEQYVLALVKIE